MTEIDELIKTEKSEEKEVVAVKKMMEDIMEGEIGKPFYEQELYSICQGLGIVNTRVLWGAWRMLIEEHKDGTPYINGKPSFGGPKPMIYNREIFENGKTVRRIGFNSPG